MANPNPADPAAQGAEERFTVFKARQGDEMVECHACGFCFDADHEDDKPGGGYSCPLCGEAALRARLEAVEGTLREIERLQKKWNAPLRHKSGDLGEAAWAVVGSEAVYKARAALNPTEQRGSDG